jgi:cytochrome P450
MLSGEFTHKRMEELRPGIEAMVDRLIDDVLAKGAPVDLVATFTQRLPVSVISALLGVPPEDDDQLLRWSLDHLGLRGDPAIAIGANRSMLAYFDALLMRMVAAPVDPAKDMLSRLAANIQAGKLDHKDAVRLAWQMYFAGADTTANTLALGTLSFLLDRAQRAILVAEPSLLGNAVEEILRFHAVAHLNVARAAAADIALGDRLIPQGDGIYALNNAAGRDPRVFEDPHRFDIERHNAEDHLSFGYGVHQCIGQPLARLELRTVFGRLFQRIPGLTLAVPLEELRFKEDMQVYGLHALPVTW